MSAQFLSTPIEYLKGVGPQRADMLKKELQLFTYGDLLFYYPYKHIDRSKFYSISELSADMPYIQLKGIITRFEEAGDKRNKRLIAYFKDQTGVIELIWFQGIKWIKENLKPQVEYVVFGKINDFKGRFSIPHPEVELYTESFRQQALSLYPNYNTTEKMKAKGLDSKAIFRFTKYLTGYMKEHKIMLPEILTDSIIQQYHFLNRTEAIANIHFPATAEMLKKAELRIKFEELFYIQLKLLKQKKVNQLSIKGNPFTKIGDYFNGFYKEKLPFELTNAQKRVLKEIRSDMGSGRHMNRLLQGDVGSGKTAVALMCMLMALDNDFQACMMAPTEILATQHYNNLKELLKDMPVTIALLTGSTRQSERREIHDDLQTGKLQLLIGTHALIEEDVRFYNLGLAIIDEQHRFGVEQRYKLWRKNTIPPHILVMTATPIPRTLAMTLYGDLDVSVIDEMPAGRKPIKTMHVYEPNRLKVWGLLRDEIKKGRQVYIVYPLIEESEKMDYLNLMEGYEIVTRDFPAPDYHVSIVHGKMKAADKEYEMQRFVNGETNIMVATTVIEVGVNVPNASVMVIESASRFGLSQLHQLRGRVGRGAEQSYCILMTDYKLGADSKLRMDTMVKTNDGFEISEVDLKLRGPGNLMGTQQSGMLNLKLADLSKDQQILSMARNAASDILNADPALTNPENMALANELKRMESTHTNWSRIS